jgi:hypothetical protein
MIDSNRVLKERHVRSKKTGIFPIFIFSQFFQFFLPRRWGKYLIKNENRDIEISQ